MIGTEMLGRGRTMPNTKRNILIVDDDPSLRKSLSQIFEQFGYDVRFAEDGFSALHEIRYNVPDILLSDLNMPGMSGFELLSVVRRRFPAVQTVAMSGAFAGDGLQLGVAADAFYEKGTGLGYLIQIVKAMSHPDRLPSFRNPSILTPLWIPSNGHNTAGQAYIMIPCPECLRTFPQILSDADTLIHATSCAYCLSLIHYAILLPTDPASPQAFQHKTSEPTVSIPIALAS
jgi:CheY-like chemotaxis protein